MPPIRLQKARRIRSAISNEIKKEICEYIMANSNVKQEEVALYFNTKYNELNIDRSTVSKIWQNREKWMAVLSTSQTACTFRHRSVQYPELDKALQIWTAQAVTAGLPLTDMILQQKGIELAQMLNIGENQIKFTNGWVYRFKKRNGLQRVKFSGEANSAPIETLPEERVRLRALLAKYDKEDIYNADETGLFFRMEPNQTLSTGAVAGRKMDKSRVSVLFCANATGSHKIRPLSTLPVIYRANSKAWMRSDIFIEWLKHLDYYFRTMDRRVLLLIDNAGSHFNPKRFKKNDDMDDEEISESDDEQESKKQKKKEKPAVDLTNIELVYLPPNTTAHLQPMDAGIIHSFKAKYKQEFCRHLIRQFDSGVDHVKNKLNIKEAIDYIAESWNNVTPTTIQNCWIKTGILPSCDDDNTDEEDLDDDELENLLINLPEETADVLEYFQLLDREIPTEEHLTEEQIIDMVRNEENQVEESEDDDENEEIPLISVKKAINGLETFVNYFEQQEDSEFNIGDLRIFRKYLRVIRVREINAKKQSTLDGFFDR
ncbi:unnamed protein product [Rhizophagus irregularis]|uniref:HTH CENPB-type domain-containing protein n=1 Tax=Rhizophagus irregularis TaxID=588596 RepID=A0A915ZYN9_9GLOM|nr:unnamed protein product [Rhizophagus irregularis]